MFDLACCNSIDMFPRVFRVYGECKLLASEPGVDNPHYAPQAGAPGAISCLRSMGFLLHSVVPHFVRHATTYQKKRVTNLAYALAE